MGRNKAYLTVGGQPLAARTADLVKSAAGAAALVGDPELYSALGHRVVPDLYPGEGPLGGILSALADTQAEWNLMVACDMPGLTAAFLKALLDFAESKQLKIVVPAGNDALWEPLCAVYHESVRETLQRAFAAGTRKITAAFGSIPVGIYPVTEMAHLKNLNTPEDWAGYAAK